MLATVIVCPLVVAVPNCGLLTEVMTRILPTSAVSLASTSIVTAVFCAVVARSAVATSTLLTGRALVPELIQENATAEAAVAALRPLLLGEGAAREQVEAFEAIHGELSRDYARRSADALATLAQGAGPPGRA